MVVELHDVESKALLTPVMETDSNRNREVRGMTQKSARHLAE